MFEHISGESGVPAHIPPPSGPSKYGTGTYPGASDGSSDWHFIDYVRVLSKRRWTAIPPFVVIVGIVAISSLTATPIYEARAQLLLEAEQQNVISFKEVVEQDRASNDYYQTQYKLLQSRALAKSTIESLQLWDNGKFAEKSGNPAQAGAKKTRPLSKFGAVVGTTRDLLVNGLDRLSAMFDAAPPPKTAEARDASETAEQSRVIERFLDSLTIAPVLKSRLVDVKFRHSDPKLAADIANALARGFIQQNQEFKFTASKEASDWLTTQLSEQRKKVEESEVALQHYREQNDAVSTENSQNIVFQKLTDLNAAVTRAKMDRIQKESLFGAVKAIQNDTTALETFPAVAANANVQRLKTELSDLRRQETVLGKQLGERHPDMVNLRSNIQNTETRLRVEIANAVKAVEMDYLAAKTQESNLVAALEAQKTEALGLNRKEIGTRALERDATSNQQIFDTLLQRAKETGISSELKTNNIRLVDEADIPRVPILPRTYQDLLMATAGGLILAVGLAFLAEYLDNKIKAPEEIQTRLGLPCLGLIPIVPKSANGEHQAPLINNGVPAGFAEAFRAMRTNVLFSSETSVRSLVVTSTAPGEGKTIVSSNLAIGLALAGQKVVLIDADMRRPKLHTIFNLDLSPGLADLISGDAKPSEAIRKTTVPRLAVLTAGTLPSNPAELLSSPQLRDLLATLLQHADWVIIDSPPVMPVTDAAILGHVADAVLFVVGAELTNAPNAARALATLEGARAKFIGAVLNRVNLERNAFFYSQYYRREYSQYYGAASHN